MRSKVQRRAGWKSFTHSTATVSAPRSTAFWSSAGAVFATNSTVNLGGATSNLPLSATNCTINVYGRYTAAQLNSLAGNTIALHFEASSQLRAMRIEQKRVFQGSPRKKAFGQARQENNLKAASSRFFNRSYEDGAETALRRFVAQNPKFFGEDIVDFIERSGTDLAHGLQLAQDREHGFGTAES